MDTPATQPQEPKPPAEGRRLDSTERRAVVRLVLGLLVLVLFIIFVIQNSQPVGVDFVFVNVRIRLIWVFLGCALIGALVAWLVGRPRRRAMQKLIDELERKGEGKGPKR